MNEHTKQAALSALQHTTSVWFDRGYADAVSGAPRPVPCGYDAAYAAGYSTGLITLAMEHAA